VESNLRLSRAYRTNLNVLALVALFAGALLVFSTQVLAVLRRRSELALLRVLGVTRGRLLWMLAGESALVGTAGALLGLLAGHLLAVTTVATIGADLGAGFFTAVKPQVQLDGTALLTFLAAGILAALAGGLLPALEAARARLAPALKAGDEQLPYARIRSQCWSAVDGGRSRLGSASRRRPAAIRLRAVALLLVGAIALVPWISARCLQCCRCLAVFRVRWRLRSCAPPLRKPA
jgi:putative ABC transport system permease protein